MQDLIDRTFDLYTQLAPDYVVAKEKLQRPPVKAVLDAFKISSDFTNGVFPPQNLIKTDFTAEEKQERQDFIQNMIEIIMQQTGKSLEVNAKSITAGKEPENTLEMLITMFEAAQKIVNQSQQPIKQVAEPEPVQEPVYQVAEPVSQPIVTSSQNQFNDNEFISEPMEDEPTEQLINYAYAFLQHTLNLSQLSTKALSRPPVKILQEIFTSFNDNTNGQFPSNDLTVRQEFSKEQKEERQSYIEAIIRQTIELSGVSLSVQAKSITGGKQVAFTLFLLITMCRLAVKSQSGTLSPPPSNVQNTSNPFTEKVEPQPISQPEPVFNAEPAPEPVQEPQQAQPYTAIPTDPSHSTENQALLNAEKQRQLDEEEDQRRYAEATRRQKEIENDQNRRLTNVFSEVQTQKATFNRPPPSQQTKRQQNIVNTVAVSRKIIEDSDSEEQVETVPEVTNGGLGAFTEGAQNVQNEFQSALNAEGEGVTQKANSSNQKLIAAISDSIRRIIPFSKATSFLEEHLVRMRSDLVQATDDVEVQVQKQVKMVNLEGKSRSVLDAKSRSLGEQAEGVRGNFNEVYGQGFMM